MEWIWNKIRWDRMIKIIVYLKIFFIMHKTTCQQETKLLNNVESVKKKVSDKIQSSVLLYNDNLSYKYSYILQNISRLEG